MGLSNISRRRARFINSSSLLRFDWIHYITFLSISLLQFRIIVYQLRFPRNTNKSFWKLGWNKNETWARLKQNGFTTSVLIIFREGTLAFKLNALRHDCSKRLKAFDSRDNRVSPRPPCSGAKVDAGRIRKYNNVYIIKAISFVCSTMHRAPGDGIWCDSRCRHHSELEFR